MGKPLVTWLLCNNNGRCPELREVVVIAFDGARYEARVLFPDGDNNPLTVQGVSCGTYSQCYEAAFSYVSRFYLGLNVARAYDL